MVHVPILKIDIPEPRLDWVIPATVTAIIKAFTAIFDWADDLVRPLSQEDEAFMDAAFVMSLPREHRIIRKRAKEENVTDMMQLSEDLEQATRAYYRRSIREGTAGFADEEADDVAWRRLVTPDTASLRVWHEYEAEQEAAAPDVPLERLAALAADAQQLLEQEEEARAAAASSRAADDALVPPSRGARVTVTTLSGAAGLAAGLGALKLLRALLKRRPRKGRRGAGVPPEAGVPPLPPGQRPRRSSGGGPRPAGAPKRRTSASGGGGGGKQGSGGGKASSSRGSSGAGTPRQR